MAIVRGYLFDHFHWDFKAQDLQEAFNNISFSCKSCIGEAHFKSLDVKGI